MKAEEKTDSFKDRLRQFLSSNDIDHEVLAKRLNASAVSVLRWETGTALPSPKQARRLEELGFEPIPVQHTNVSSRARLGRNGPSREQTIASETLRVESARKVKGSDNEFTIFPAPYVRNGPPDQSEFFDSLINMQTSLLKGEPDAYRRLSVVECVNELGTTAQFDLEAPKPTSLSWSGNYGPHGWHRYVGRFPPHLVRALLNYFGAKSSHVVMDPFMGSGTTAVECRLLGIPFFGVEICPLSVMMSRVKSHFPIDVSAVSKLIDSYTEFYDSRWRAYTNKFSGEAVDHATLLKRHNNPIPEFANYEKWFSFDALLGASITVEFALQYEGYLREFLLLALSSKMRSIGNLDVDVVRAEYSKKPRENVDVKKLVLQQLRKMIKGIQASARSHKELLGSPENIMIHEGSVLEVELGENAVDFIITSPPYGVESISYLRTHLLSYRTLVSHLKHDPYETRDKTIGSEYIGQAESDAGARALEISPIMRSYFAQQHDDQTDRNYRLRRLSMMQFCDDMLATGQRMARWLRPSGKIAFVIGNKRLGKSIIPMDEIVEELFGSCGLVLSEKIRHKLKTNNSNSQVPWQERTIQEEYILIFRGTLN